jgi:hypothetical protein
VQIHCCNQLACFAGVVWDHGKVFSAASCRGHIPGLERDYPNNIVSWQHRTRTGVESPSRPKVNGYTLA